MLVTSSKGGQSLEKQPSNNLLGEGTTLSSIFKEWLSFLGWVSVPDWIMLINHVVPHQVLHSPGEWSSVLSQASVSHWKLINYLQDLLGHRVLGPRPEYVSASTCKIYLDIVSLTLDQNTLEPLRVPSHMLGALPWHQPAWSQTKNPKRLLGALGYLLGFYSAIVNWLGYHYPWEWVLQLHYL